jgi:hypothetical protein
MIDQQTFEVLVPLAYEWAKKQEEFVLTYGIPLDQQQMADARLAGIKECERVRVLVVDRIPVPETGDLAQAARRSSILTEDSRCTGFGHAIIIRADVWGDRELLLHNLIHLAQCERSGGLQQWIRLYLADRNNCADFTVGPLEEEARHLARELCNGAGASMAKGS